MATLYYRPYTAEPITDGSENLPPHNAVETILPEYQYIFVDKDRPTGRPGKSTVRPDDTSSVHLLDHQMRELERYRTAVHKMGEDILSLRSEIRDLEANNSRLRRDLSKYNDTTKLLLDSQELDGLTKPELSARYVALKQKLTSQTGELRYYKDRVQKLQNDLIRRNDSEKDHLRMSQAHTTQNELLQRLQEKASRVKKLEDACRKQEKVIEKMERLLQGKPQPRGKNDSRDPTTDALIAENRRLRADIDDLRDTTRTLQAGRGLRAADDEEKLRLLQQQGRDEGRILSLEKQLSDNARKWGREKADLLTKLQEAELGLRRTSNLGGASMNPVYSYDSALRDDSRRFSKAPTRQPKYGTVGGRHDKYSY